MESEHLGLDAWSMRSPESGVVGVLSGRASGVSWGGDCLELDAWGPEPEVRSQTSSEERLCVKKMKAGVF